MTLDAASAPPAPDAAGAADTAPETMTAVAVTRIGDASAWRAIETPIPVPGPGQVLVRLPEDDLEAQMEALAAVPQVVSALGELGVDETTTFAELIGQEPMVRTLGNAIARAIITGTYEQK